MDRSPIYNPSRSLSAESSESSAPHATMIPNSTEERLLPDGKPPSPHHNPKTSTKKGVRTPSRKIALSAFLISLLCLLLLALSALLVFFYLKDLQGGVVQGHEEVCMPCDQVRPNPLSDARSPLLDLMEVRPSKDDVDTEICCAHTAAQYAALFKLILQRQEEVKRLADALDTDENNAEAPEKDVPQNHLTRAAQPVSAHVVFKPVSNEKSNSHQHWKSPQESPKSHVKHGLKFHHNQISVQTPGLYFIYCQILYSPSNSSSDGPTLVSNYVQRHSILHPVTSSILLKSRHTQYDANQDRHSSYVGGVFQLYREDTLYVQVSRPELVSDDDSATYFGLFKLGE